MESGIRYTDVIDMMLLSPWDAGHKQCIQLMLTDGSSVLLQVG